MAKRKLILKVGKENYECKEVLISSNFDSSQLLQIQLKPTATVKINFAEALPLPISVGILGNNGELLQNPTPIKTYFSNIASGQVTFSNLGEGVYFIGYYWDNTDALIFRQCPIQIEATANIDINSNLIIQN